jgi:hypothetical protein
MIYTKEVEMININSVVAVVDILLKDNNFERAEKIVNENLNELEIATDKLRKLKKVIVQQETNVH